ncbi:unnamed protein product [Parnassius mnemosyne]|uniref:Uncharacterized protein n=1 Tax=Parnassius mnemosyne TaxID=213953 RepID=A0AAV1LXH4_9NEOP
MALLYLLSFMLVASLCEMPEAQCLPRRPLTSCNYDELNVLLTLARALEENENSKSVCKNGVDVEEIIMKLINALVYTTVSSAYNGGGGKKYGKGGKGSSSNNNKNEGLIDLDLLDQNDPNNILKLDLANKTLLGIGLGDSKNNDKSGKGGKGSSGNKNKNEGLIDLDLLNLNDPDNILKLDLANQTLLGIGLGDGKNNYKSGKDGKGSSGNKNKNEGLIDLDLLNLNDPDNILKLDLAKQTLLGIGLGDTN